MTDLLSWAAGLGTFPKILASVVATLIWLFVLVVLWGPKSWLPTSARPSAPSISQQSTGPNSPNIAVVGSGNIVNPLLEYKETMPILVEVDDAL